MNLPRTHRRGGPRPRALNALVGLAVVILASVVLTAPAASSKSPHEVDPATLQPTLNPNFAPWSCFEAGVGVTCQGSFDATYNEPIGLFCAGQEVWIQGRAHEQMTRWHTGDGLATKTRVQLSYPADVFSLSPTGEGPSITFSGHFNRHYTYAVPGDPDSRTLTERGVIYFGTADGRVVFKDVGTVTFEPGQDFETIASLHGLHDYYSSYPNEDTTIDSLICDTLT